VARQFYGLCVAFGAWVFAHLLSASRFRGAETPLQQPSCRRQRGDALFLLGAAES
jgi:hypothetical protein